MLGVTLAAGAGTGGGGGCPLKLCSIEAKSGFWTGGGA
jgi:hypothetical protein